LSEHLEPVHRGLAVALTGPTVADLLATAGPKAARPDPLADLTARLDRLEQAQAWLVHRLDQVDALIREGDRGVVRELDGLRRELMGDRKAAAAFAVLGAVAPALEQLRAVLEGLGPEADPAVARQLAWAADVLLMPLRTLGFDEFTPEPGDPFDPTRMQCEGTAEGPPDRVVRTTRPGYRCRDAVSLPARVLVGQSAAPAAPQPMEAPPDA
jgi:molecular chaperone GrpE (heat shock protein)